MVVVVVIMVVVLVVVEVGPNSSAGLGQRLRCRQLRASHRPGHSCPVQATHLDPLLCTLTSYKKVKEKTGGNGKIRQRKGKEKREKRPNYSCPLLAAFHARL